MDVPVYLGAAVEVRVDVWKEVRRDKWRDDGLYAMVEEEGGNEFMSVEREG